MYIFVCVCDVSLCVCVVKILSPDVHRACQTGHVCTRLPCPAACCLRLRLRSAICICIYRMHKAIGLFSNTVAVQICLRVGGGEWWGNVICVNICQAFSLIFGSFSSFPFSHSLACAVYLFCCIFFFFICRMINSLRNRRMPRKLPHFERFTCFAFRFLLCKQNSALASSASASELEIFYINLAHYKQNSGRPQESALGHCFDEIRSVSVWLSHAIYLYIVVAALSPD